MPAPQILPQYPQFLASVAKSTHAPLQIDCPVGHAVMQLPVEHRALPPVGAAHARLHAPQCSSEV